MIVRVNIYLSLLFQLRILYYNLSPPNVFFVIFPNLNKVEVLKPLGVSLRLW